MRYVITLNGNKYEVDVDGVNAVVHPDGPPSTAMPVAAQAAAPAVAPTAAPVAAGEGTQVKSPLPGKVMDVPVSVGSTVSANDVVCVIEAMKMENEIKAGVAGTVTSVVVSKGSSVETDDVLVTIK